MNQKINITITEEMHWDDLISIIFEQISNDDIIQFIIELEKYYEDWDITESLYEYFKSEMDELKNE